MACCTVSIVVLGDFHLQQIQGANADLRLTYWPLGLQRALISPLPKHVPIRTPHYLPGYMMVVGD